MPHTPSLMREPAQLPLSGALAFIGRTFSRAVLSWEKRRQLAHAVGLDDHLLADIGLTREDMNSARRFLSARGRMER
jgi:uncharacterized protein YjiS (DUF1127 family)